MKMILPNNDFYFNVISVFCCFVPFHFVAGSISRVNCTTIVPRRIKD